MERGMGGAPKVQGYETDAVSRCFCKLSLPGLQLESQLPRQCLLPLLNNDMMFDVQPNVFIVAQDD